MRKAVMKGHRCTDVSANESSHHHTHQLHAPLKYGTDINVVKFDKATRKRIAFKTSGNVPVEEYDAALNNSWSVRFLRPQEHEPTLSEFMAALDDELGCNVGLNSYWTPKNSQGFAPHYDDVDVFMLQLEGSKVWKLYRPPKPEDELARFSSPDYDPRDLPDTPDYVVTLEAGDTLYLPRGWVHQGHTLNTTTTHSLHVTLSAFQLMTTADLLLAVCRERLEWMAARDVTLRKTLPLGWWSVMGTAANAKIMGPYAALSSLPVEADADDADDDCGTTPATTAEGMAVNAALSLRQSILASVRSHIADLAKDIALRDGPADRGADAVAREVVFRRQPPLGGKKKRTPHHQQHQEHSLPESIRIVSPFNVRVVVESDRVDLYHSCDNDRVCLGRATAPLTFDMAFAPALVHLTARAGRWCKVADLPLPDLEDDAEEDGEGDAEEGPTNRDGAASVKAENLALLIHSLLGLPCVESR